MKNLVLLFIVLLLARYNLFAQSGWVEQTSGTTADLNSVYFVNNTVGWAVGFNGTIIHTIDGGENWSPQSSNTYATLTLVRFFDDNTGWIYGEGQIQRTTNGGEDWIMLNAPEGPGYFLTNDIGWIAHFPYLLFTTNGGQSWDTVYTWTGSVIPLSIYFNSEYVGFMKVSGTGINPDEWSVRTSDGGYSWQGLTINGWVCESFSFINDSVGWACLCPGGMGMGGYIAKTENAGTNWIEQINIGQPFNDVFFTNYEKGWAIEGDSIWCTSDGGENWFNQSLQTIEFWNSIYFSNENNGWVIGENGQILHTTSGGVVSVEEEMSAIPNKFYLAQNYPNPFNPSTTISWQSPVGSHQVIKLFDVLGKEVETIVDGYYEAGNHSTLYIVNSALPSGVYFYQLKAGEYIQTKKMILLK